jgi:hypothetical protein
VWTAASLAPSALEWNMVAILSSWSNTNGTTPHVGWLWKESDPQLVEAAFTVTTAGSGNLTGGLSTLTLGNRSSGSNQLVGVIGPHFFMASSVAVGVTTNPLHVTAFGNCTTEMRGIVHTRYVEPFLHGTLPWEADNRLMGSSAGITATTWAQFVDPYDRVVTSMVHGGASDAAREALGVTGSPTQEELGPAYRGGIILPASYRGRHINHAGARLPVARGLM